MLVNSELFLKTETLQIIHGDILSVYTIANENIDLIVTSPPYNVDISYNNHYDKMTYNDYIKWSEKWIARCYELLKSDGRFCLNIPLDKNKGGQQSVYADIINIAKRIGWKYHSTIIWNE